MMSTQQYFEFLLVQLRNLQSAMDMVIACAVRDNQFRDGWQCDWEGARNEIQNDFNKIVKELEQIELTGKA